MIVPFEKWHGCQNDFIIIFLHSNQKELLEALKESAPKLCAKDGSGIAADGILIHEFEEGKENEFTPRRLLIINQDGSEASNCGNGLRCAALALYRRAKNSPRKIDIPDSVELNVLENSFLCRFSEKLTKEDLPESVTISIGVPKLNETNSWHKEALEATKKEMKSKAPSYSYDSISSCELGNKHIVILAQEKLDEAVLDRVASELQEGYSWDGINVHLAREVPEETTGKRSSITKEANQFYEILHWERGCGPTKGCGSGASSLAASIFAEGFSEEGDKIAVRMPGGPVCITNRGEGAPLELTGPAQFVFEGTLDF